MSELAKTSGELPLMQMIQGLLERVGDPEKAVEVVERMIAAHERQQDRQARQAYLSAVAEFQALCPQIKKEREVRLQRGGQVSFRYAGLDDIMRVIGGILQRCGLSVSYDCEFLTDSKMLRVVCYVQHGAHREPHSVTLPMPGNVQVNDTQKMGMAISYAKRYALCAALNIVVTDEDNDAAGLTETITVEQEARLAELLQWSGISKERFLRHNGYENLGVIPADRFASLESALIQRGKAAGK